MPDYSKLRKQKVPGQKEELITTTEGKKFGSNIELASHLGVKPHEIDWAKISPAEPVTRYGEEDAKKFDVELPGEAKTYQKAQDLIATIEGEQKSKADIMADMRNRYQAYIDSINARYAEEISGEKEKGVERLGMQRAMAGAGGIMGSPMFGQQKAEVERGTQEIVKNLQAQRQAEIGKIFGKIDENVEKKLEAQRTRALKSAEANLKLLESIHEDTKEMTKSLAEQGVKWSNLAEEDQESIKDTLGWTDFQTDLFMESNQPQPEKPEVIHEDIYEKDGNAWIRRVVQYNDDRVEKKEYDMQIPYSEIAEKGRMGYTPKVLDDGTVIFFPDEFDTSKSLDEQVIQWGAKGEYAKPKTGDKDEIEFKFGSSDVRDLTNAGFSSTDVSDLQKLINEFGWEAVKGSGKIPEDKIEVVDRIMGGKEEEDSAISTEDIDNEFSEKELINYAKEYAPDYVFTAGLFQKKRLTDKKGLLNFIKKTADQRKRFGLSDEEIWNEIIDTIRGEEE